MKHYSTVIDEMCVGCGTKLEYTVLGYKCNDCGMRYMHVLSSSHLNYFQHTVIPGSMEELVLLLEIVAKDYDG
jgi:tRNA(Ile2) C34 agmatinyltransferase TiaS